MREPTGALTVLRLPSKVDRLMGTPKAHRLRSHLELTISRSLKNEVPIRLPDRSSAPANPVTAHPPKPCPAIISLGKGNVNAAAEMICAKRKRSKQAICGFAADRGFRAMPRIEMAFAKSAPRREVSFPGGLRRSRSP